MRTKTLGFFIALLVTACGGDDASEAPEPERESPGSGSAVLAEDAKVLDDAGLDALSSFEGDGSLLELSFSSRSSVLDSVASGDVLILGAAEAAPHGALVKVEEVAASGDGLVLRGRAAELGEAFEELSLSLATVLDEPSFTSLESQSQPRVATSRQALGLTFPVALSAESDAGSFELDGSLSLDSDLDLKLDFDFSSFQLDELSLTFSAKETFLAELTGQGEASFDESTTLGSVSFAPITLLLPIPAPPGIVPVVLTPGVSLQAGLKGSIRGDVEASVTQRAAFTAGLGYKDGEFGGFSEDDSDFDFEQPTYEASASIKAWAGPRLEVLLYGAVGPFAGVEAFVEAAANAEGPPLCATGIVDAGLSATVGVDFLADYSTTLFDHRYPLAKFDSCSDDPDAPRPALTWARTFGREGSSGEQAKAIIELSDGSYLVVGDSELFEGVTAFAASVWAVRLDPLGNVIWERAVGALSRQGVTRGVAEVEGGFLVLGASGVMKLDVGGNLIWAKSYSSDGGLELVSIAPADGESSIVAGIAGSPGRAIAMKLDPAGDVVWARGYAGDDVGRVRSSADGGALLVGKVETDGDDLYLAKLDADGEVVWQRAVDNRFDTTGGEEEPILSSSGDRGYDVVEKPDGGYLVAGESYGNFPLPEVSPVGFYASWVAELDEDGELTGAGSTLYRAPEEAAYGGAYAVGVRPNGSSVVVGRRADSAEDLFLNEDVLVIQGGAFSLLGGAGNDAVYGGTLAGVGRGMPLQMTADGGSIVAVTSDSFAGQDQFWVIKLNRTAGIHSDYRKSVTGASYENPDAVSSSLNASSTELDVTVEAFTEDVLWEDAGLVSASQSQ
jgi:hypothetical protein